MRGGLDVFADFAGGVDDGGDEVDPVLREGVAVIPDGIATDAVGVLQRDVAGYNSRLQLSESYVAWNNNPSTAPLVSCLNWGKQPNYHGAIYQFCPVSNAGASNGNLQSASYPYSGPDYAKPVTVNQSYTADAGTG